MTSSKKALPKQIATSGGQRNLKPSFFFLTLAFWKAEKPKCAVSFQMSRYSKPFIFNTTDWISSIKVSIDNHFPLEHSAVIIIQLLFFFTGKLIDRICQNFHTCMICLDIQRRMSSNLLAGFHPSNFFSINFFVYSYLTLM